MNFQNMILKLQEYWSSQGCILMQAYDSEKGAGTLNPQTFLRSLGPEPWKVCYVEPSRRPADARYGENPNRLYQHHQLQVILKPSPDNVQELYLGSLRAIGGSILWSMISDLSKTTGKILPLEHGDLDGKYGLLEWK